MRALVWIVRFALFLLILGFAVRNNEPVRVQFYLGAQWEAPLAFVMLVVFAIGAAAGVTASLGYLFRQRRELLQARKQLRTQPTEEPR